MIELTIDYYKLNCGQKKTYIFGQVVGWLVLWKIIQPGQPKLKLGLSMVTSEEMHNFFNEVVTENMNNGVHVLI